MKPWLRTLACLPLAAGLLLPAGEEPTAKEIVRALERHYNRTRTFEADFIQRYTRGNMTRIESGRVYFRKPGRMRWEYEDPTAKLFLTDGEYAYLYVPEERQVRRQPIKQAPEWQAAFALLLGRVDLDRIFSQVDLVWVPRPGSPAKWQLRGRPESEKQGFQEIWFDLNEHFQVLRMEIRQHDGSLMEFHFRRWRENLPLSPQLFRLQVPPGTAWMEEAPS